MRNTNSPRNNVSSIAVILLLALLCCVLSCAPGQSRRHTQLTQANRVPTNDPAAIAVLDAFIDSLNNLDEERFVSLFAPDATAFFQFQDSPTELYGSDGIRAFIVPLFSEMRRDSGKEGPPYMNLAPQDVRVTVSENTGVLTFQIDGPHVTSRRTLILRYKGPSCHIIHFHGSDIRRNP